jgi:hypothetical protein
MKRIIIVIAGFLLLAPLTLAGVAQATAPSGVTSTTFRRISLGPYHQTSAGLKLFAKGPTDTITTITPGASIGWHSHPGLPRTGGHTGRPVDGQAMVATPAIF